MKPVCAPATRASRAASALVGLSLVGLLAGCGAVDTTKTSDSPYGSGTSSTGPSLAPMTPTPTATSTTSTTPTSTSTTPAAPPVTTPATTPATKAALRVLVLGDSVASASPSDCRGCAGFANLYARDLGRRAKRPVAVDNRAHGEATAVSLDRQVLTSKPLQTALRSADVVIVSVGFYEGLPWPKTNPCGRAFANARDQLEVVAGYSSSCIRQNIALYRKHYDKLYADVAGRSTRSGAKLIALDTYNNWPGHPVLTQAPGTLYQRGVRASVPIYDLWNNMLQAAAKRAGYYPADVYHAFNGASGAATPRNYLAHDFVNPSALGDKRIAGLLAAAPAPSS